MSKPIIGLLCSPEIAKDIGLDEAILLHLICFWVELNKRNESIKHYKKGKCWMYYSDTKICLEMFPFFKPHQIKRMRKNLKDKGYIETGSFNAFGPDKTTWYTYTDKVFEIAGLKYIEKILKKNKSAPYLLDKNDS